MQVVPHRRLIEEFEGNNLNHQDKPPGTSITLGKGEDEIITEKIEL